jgi:predicted nucleic acid-binding Zn ribbon protein
MFEKMNETRNRKRNPESMLLVKVIILLLVYMWG